MSIFHGWREFHDSMPHAGRHAITACPLLSRKPPPGKFKKLETLGNLKLPRNFLLP